MFRALRSVSCDITHDTGGTICYEHWVLRLAISYSRDREYDLRRALGSVSLDILTKQGVRVVTGPGFCRRYDLLRALGYASCDICYKHWVLPFVISHTKQGVRFITGIGFKRNRG